jgi:hypothetical protein
MSLGVVRAAQGRNDEAEALLREAVDRASDRVPQWITATTVRRLAEFLRTRGSPEEAGELEASVARLGGERVPGAL